MHYNPCVAKSAIHIKIPCLLHWRNATKNYIQITTIAIQNWFCVAKIDIHFPPTFQTHVSDLVVNVLALVVVDASDLIIYWVLYSAVTIRP